MRPSARSRPPGLTTGPIRGLFWQLTGGLLAELVVRTLARVRRASPLAGLPPGKTELLLQGYRFRSLLAAIGLAVNGVGCSGECWPP
jgi:hypothetical protein